MAASTPEIAPTQQPVGVHGEGHANAASGPGPLGATRTLRHQIALALHPHAAPWRSGRPGGEVPRHGGMAQRDDAPTSPWSLMPSESGITSSSSRSLRWRRCRWPGWRRPGPRLFVGLRLAMARPKYLAHRQALHLRHARGAAHHDHALHLGGESPASSSVRRTTVMQRAVMQPRH